jgi:hypothetical protein
LNWLNLFIHNPRRMFLVSTENWRCTLLKCFQALPMEWCVITPFTASCNLCRVMCSIIFGDMNNFYSLCMIGKYISFLYVTSPSPANHEFITRMPTYSVLGQLYIFKVVQHAEVWTHVNFLVSYTKGFHHGLNNIEVLFQFVFLK